MGSEVLSRGLSGRGLSLTTHPHLDHRLRMSRTIPLFPLCLLRHVIGWPLPFTGFTCFYCLQWKGPRCMAIQRTKCCEHLAVGPRRKTWLLSQAWLTGHVFLRFLTQRPSHAFVSWPGSLIASRLSTAWCRMLGVPSYQQKDRSCSPIFRTIRLQHRDHSSRHSAFLQLQSWLCVGMFCKRTIFCVSYMRMHVLMSLIIVTESLDSDGDVHTTSSRKQLRSSIGPLTPQFPYPFFLILWVGTVLNRFGRSAILVTTASKHMIQGGYSKFGPCMNILYKNLGQFTAKTRTVTWWSHEPIAG
jgi:hypothetical protein